MVHSTILIFLLAISTVLVVSKPNVLVLSKPNLPWGSDRHEQLPPFPPGPPPEFKGILPSETFDELTAIHQNQSLTIPQKLAKIEEIMKALPEDVLERLPLPPVFRLLPQDVQEMMKTVRTAKNLTMDEKRLQMMIIIESLPKEQQRMLQQTMPNFPPGRLADLKDILPREAWDKLVAVHQDFKLNNVQKMKRIDEIIDTLPSSIRRKLPLSSPFQKLPAYIQEKLQAIRMEQELSTEQRFEKIKAVIETLPWDTKKLIFPH